MAEIKKVQIWFNLEDDMDSTLWNQIEQQVQQKKGNSYLKNLILLGLTKEEQRSLLEEMKEIKQILRETGRECSQLSFAGKEEEQSPEKPAKSEVTKERLSEILNEVPMDAMETKEEVPSLDEKVVNYLDTL